MSRSTEPKAGRAEQRDERTRKQVFPDSDGVVFDAKTKGFVPIPIEFRALLRYLTPPELRVLLYLNLRSGKIGISFPSVDEIAHDIGVKTAKHVRPLLRSLETKEFIRSGRKNGRTYFLVHDPSVPILHLLKTKAMSPDEFRDINGLREDIGHSRIEEPAEL